MKWTKERPQKAGWYWAKPHVMPPQQAIPSVISIIAGQPVATGREELFMCTNDPDIPVKRLELWINECEFEMFWAGPIEEPEE